MSWVIAGAQSVFDETNPELNMYWSAPRTVEINAT